MKTITKKRLLQMGFEEVKEEKTEQERSFINGQFRVVLIKGQKDDPIISVHGVNFPGAYTIRHLMDIIFFHLGEDGITKFRNNWTLPTTAKMRQKKYTLTQFFCFTDWQSTNCKQEGIFWSYEGTKYTMTELFKIWESKQRS